jgi:cell division protein FtsB
MAHTVRTNRINTKHQQKALATLQARNPQLKGKVKLLRLA